MTRAFPTALLFGLLCVPIKADTTFYSYAFAKQYAVVITREAIKKSPTWPKDAENPPLSARKAIALANELKDSLVEDSEEFKWKLESASLQPLSDGKWYWLLHYKAEFQGISSGIPNHLKLVVLMDGTVIKPVVKP